MTDALPLQLAIRLSLDNVSYSNPVPEWFEVTDLNYLHKEETLRATIRRYLGGDRPGRPFILTVPAKSGALKSWSVSSVDDQIILQACVSCTAEILESKSVDRDRVYSCRVSTNPNRVSLMEDQVAWWQRFQNDTRQRCASDECLLQIDLENAFGSISRPSFFEFVRSVVPRRQPVELLELLLDSLADGQKGLPLVNDSVFFLGNAYFSVVDHVVAEHTRDFIRFVDDYRIFGRSRAELESLAEKIGVSLRRLGFKINTGKLKVGTGAEYLEAISRLRYVDTTQKTRHEPFDKDDSGYTDPAVLGDVIPPEKMVELIAKTLENPEQYMHQGFGRFQIAALRRLRFDGLVASRRKADFSQRDIFSRLLSQREDLIRRAIELLSTYAERNDQLWRTLWLLYLAKDISSEGLPKASPAVREFDELRDRIRRANSVPTVARLWAAPMPDFPALPSKKKEALEMLHQAGYLERGMQCYGDPNA